MHHSTKFLVLLISIMFLAVSCSEPESTKGDNDGAGHEHSHDGHDHDHDGHSHGTEGDGDSNAPSNAMCPMMDDNKASAEHTVEFQGKKVGFCCSKCVTAWAKLSDADKAEKLKQ